MPLLIKTIQSSVLYISNRIRQTIYFDIRAKNCPGKGTEQIKHIPDSRKRLSAPLRTTENQNPVRIEIRRIRLTKSTLVLHRCQQIIYINMTSFTTSANSKITSWIFIFSQAPFGWIRTFQFWHTCHSSGRASESGRKNIGGKPGRVRLTKSTLVLHRRRQIIYINMT